MAVESDHGYTAMQDSMRSQAGSMQVSSWSGLQKVVEANDKRCSWVPSHKQQWCSICWGAPQWLQGLLTVVCAAMEISDEGWVGNIQVHIWLVNLQVSQVVQANEWR